VTLKLPLRLDRSDWTIMDAANDIVCSIHDEERGAALVDLANRDSSISPPPAAINPLVQRRFHGLSATSPAEPEVLSSERIKNLRRAAETYGRLGAAAAIELCDEVLRLRARLSELESGPVALTSVALVDSLKARVDELEAERDEARAFALKVSDSHVALTAQLAAALELADDLRSYTHDWDWKYGKTWDEQRAALAAMSEKETPPLARGYLGADSLLAKAQEMVQELREDNDDTQYGLLESAYDHIISARADLDADLK